MLEDYLDAWSLTPDGAAFQTHSSKLMPVRWRGLPAMLKVAVSPEEKFGSILLRYWDGDGAAKVYRSDETALLLERAEGTRSLSDFARNGRDDEATRILCDTIAMLHRPRTQSPPLSSLVPLDVWFRDLEPAAAEHGGILALCATAARDLLADPREKTVLHGDAHHDNVLDFGTRGWLAIDPKHIHGERGFDYAILFCDPDLSDLTRPVATRPGRFERRLEIVCERAGLNRERQLQWILAWCGLSAAWFLEDGEAPETNFHIARRAAAALGL